ncbi:MAG: creatininase family protein [Ignavibacteria bacterium]|nr:creatininase family protein [Ignavibacteria bacterium]
MSRKYILNEQHWKSIKDHTCNLAILPWGSCEPHNYHLPFGTDTIQSEYIASEAARKAEETGSNVLVLPAIGYGVNIAQLNLNMTISISPSTQLQILHDIITSLLRHNVSKLLIINGHGGNDFKPIIRELQLVFPSMFVGLINWWQIPIDKKHYANPGEHAGELETGNVMHIAPHLVLPIEEAGEGTAKSFNLPGFKDGWAWSPRPWELITEDTGIGNPKNATSEMGKSYLEEVTTLIAAVMGSLSRADMTCIFK